MIQAVFERKPDFRLRDVVIETVTRLPKEEYAQFLSSPCDSYAFIEKNSKSLLMDEKNGVFYCMLVTGEGYRDGVRRFLYKKTPRNTFTVFRDGIFFSRGTTRIEKPSGCS